MWVASRGAWSHPYLPRYCIEQSVHDSDFHAYMWFEVRLDGRLLAIRPTLEAAAALAEVHARLLGGDAASLGIGSRDQGEELWEAKVP